MLRPPFSSEFDPSEEAEGSIDPLGLQPGYERLADRLLPAVTVRMGHPRFVTAMAVGACICDEGHGCGSSWRDNAALARVEVVCRRGVCRRSGGPCAISVQCARRHTSKRPPRSASPACFAVLRAESEFSPTMGRSTTGATNWSQRRRRTRVWTASLMRQVATGTPSAISCGAR